MSRMLTRKDSWDEVLRSERFERAVFLIKKHGKSTNTAPGVSTSMCRAMFANLIKNSHVTDMNCFIEEQIEYFNEQIDSIIENKLKMAEEVATQEVVKVWTIQYTEQTNKEQNVRVTFVTELVQCSQAQPIHLIEQQQVPQTQLVTCKKVTENTPVDTHNESKETDFDTSKIEKALRQRRAVQDVLEQLAMLEESHSNPTCRGNKSAKFTR